MVKQVFVSIFFLFFGLYKIKGTPAKSSYLVVPSSVQHYLQGIIIQLALERENNVLLPQRHSFKCLGF